MKTLIVYHSKYGSTKEYAKWIGEELDADIVDLKAPMNLKSYDNIVIGSAVLYGSSKGASYIKKNWTKIKDKKIAYFTVSGEPKESPGIKKMYESSLPRYIREKIRFFPLDGRIIWDSMSMIDKLIIWLVKREKGDSGKTIKEDIKPITKYVKDGM